ncbi:MAG: hypothetical protein Q9164_001392 [Protoblastenia rupestris]
MLRDFSLHRRLLRDIDEVKKEPYPNVTFHVHNGLTRLCLTLTPDEACFCLKESFLKVKLGVGVHVSVRGRQGTFEPEFDLLSLQGFFDRSIRRSNNGLDFEGWLPLPISRRHWQEVHLDINPSLKALANEAKLSDNSNVNSARVDRATTLAIIEEAIVRNVIWMLETKGAEIPELTYLEPSTIEYRLEKIFRASLVSYQLLMFCSLFCKSARSDATKSLASIPDEMFNIHGAPPRGMAERMAGEIRRIKTIDSFPSILQDMGVKDIPKKSQYIIFLREMVTESVTAGYSNDVE